MREEGRLSVQDMDVLKICEYRQTDEEVKRTLEASDGTSPCRFRTMSTSCMTSKIG